ncbi:MAG TPA: HD domain-containing protein [Polyangiaceae bacterium]|nr:HD domain-containing protein [Polyangiaceae bacterium]
MDATRLEKQIAFLKEIDRLKLVERQSVVSGARRQETSAEHSWHVALMAVVLSEYAPPGVDPVRAQTMLLIHDLVEIDAGDLLLYADDAARALHAQREQEAARRLFSLLPSPEGERLRALWEEFERRESPDARFAAALDRLQPLLLNFMSEGATWRRHGVTAEQVRAKNRHMAEGSPELWRFAEQLIAESVRRGYLATGVENS